MKTNKLTFGKFYHIYNRGTNSCNLFNETTNYEHFLRLYDKYISPIADTFAWVLMKNHFHLLIKIKEENCIDFIEQNTERSERHFRVPPDIISTTQPFKTSALNQKKFDPTLQFSHLFNAYSKAFNKKYERTGSLFEHPFKRIEITDNNYLHYLVHYIHHNPVHHGFCKHMVEYPWSSYLTILSPKQTRLKRDEVLKWFNNTNNFKEYHNNAGLIKEFSFLHID